MAPQMLLAHCRACGTRAVGSRRPAHRAEPFKPVRTSKKCTPSRSVRVSAAAPDQAPRLTPEQVQAIVDAEEDDYSLDVTGGSDMAFEAELEKLIIDNTAAEEVIEGAENLFTDDAPMVLTEEKAELYTRFEKTAKEVIGTIKDDMQADIGIPASELTTLDESEALQADDFENLLTEAEEEDEADEEGALATSEDDDEEDDELVSGGGNTIAEVAQYVESLNLKYELEEKLDDAMEQAEAAASQPVENVEYDEVDAFFNDFIPGLEDKLPEFPPPEYKLSFLYLENNIGVSVDQVFAKGQRAPLTEYFFWPKRDAWDDLKAALEARPWISERDKVILLNRTTEVINYWQDEEVKHTVDEARTAFADCSFAAKS